MATRWQSCPFFDWPHLINPNWARAEVNRIRNWSAVPPTSSSDTSSMKQGGGQQRVCLPVNCGCFSEAASDSAPAGSILEPIGVGRGCCCISWSRQTPSTRPLLRACDGGICSTVAASISDLLPLPLRRLFLGPCLPCDGAPLSGCHDVVGAAQGILSGPCKETQNTQREWVTDGDREAERERERDSRRERVFR